MHLQYVSGARHRRRWPRQQDVAEAALEASRVNELRPPDVLLVPTADCLARGRSAELRVDLKTEILQLWVYQHSKDLIGDQDAVVVSKPGIGYLPRGSGPFGAPAQACILRKFRSVRYHPEEHAVFPDYLFRGLTLPHLDRDGLAFDGARMLLENVAVMNVDVAPSPKRRRPIEIELTPVDDGPAPTQQMEIEDHAARLARS